MQSVNYAKLWINCSVIHFTKSSCISGKKGCYLSQNLIYYLHCDIAIWLKVIYFNLIAHNAVGIIDSCRFEIFFSSTKWLPTVLLLIHLHCWCYRINNFINMKKTLLIFGLAETRCFWVYKNNLRSLIALLGAIFEIYMFKQNFVYKNAGCLQRLIMNYCFKDTSE